MIGMLYYPLVNPPADLLAQAVLYWDELGSIVPAEYDYPESLTRLQDAQLYRPVRFNGIGSTVTARVSDEVVALLEYMPAEALEIPDGELTSYTRLYRGKLPPLVEGLLLSYGVMKESGDAYQVSSDLLAPLLALVARAIAEPGVGDNPTRRWVTHTNLPASYLAAYEALRPQTPVDRVWRLNLGSIFPKPAPDTPLSDLIRFRRDYDDERRQLLRAVEQLVASLGGHDNPDVLPELADHIDDARKAFEAAAAGRGMKLSAGATFAVLGVETGVVADLYPNYIGLGVLGGIFMSAVPGLVRRGPTSPYTYLQRAEGAFSS